jgi:hypothetical protein
METICCLTGRISPMHLVAFNDRGFLGLILHWILNGFGMEILPSTTVYALQAVTRSPGATSLTWVILANISHKSTCKITFLYCGSNSSWSMTLTTWLCIRSHFNQMWEFLEKILKDFSQRNGCKYVLLYCGPSRPPRTMIWTNLNLHYQKAFM